jgi:hypothetical protein
MLQIKERTLAISFVVFTFRLAFEFFKECGGVSVGVVSKDTCLHNQDNNSIT